MTPIQDAVVIDDNDADQLMTQKVLRQHNPNIKIYQANHGLEALEVLSTLTTTPRIIFLDIYMPRMNGFEFLQEVSKTYHNKDLSIAMLTSSGRREDQIRCNQFCHVKLHLIKPLSEDSIHKVCAL